MTKKYLVPLFIYGDWKPIIKTIYNIFIFGFFLLPHSGAQMSNAQLETEIRTQKTELAMQMYRLDRLERMMEENSKESKIGWDKVGAICAVLGLITAILSYYVKGQIRISVLEFAHEVSKDLDNNFIGQKAYDSGMKRILSELESVKEQQRRLLNATKSG